jgi:hypothetical protein
VTVVPGTDLSLLDLALGQGEPAALAAARQQVGADPLLLVALAEEVAFVQSARLLVAAPGPAFAGKLADVIRQAEQRLPAAPPSRRPWWWLAAAAAAVFVALVAWDPLRPRRAEAPSVEADFTALAAPATDLGAPEVSIDEPSPSWTADVAVIRRRLDLEAMPLLRESFDDGLRRSGDGLRAWLDPRNALMLARFDFELRASAEVRRAAIARRGGLPSADERVQALADEIAAAPLSAADPATLGYAARALVAAGAATPSRRAAVVHAGRLLLDGLATARGEALAVGLSGLLDVALATGEFTAEVRRHGERLVADLLATDDDTWLRRLPALLSSSASPAVVAEAARVLAQLPAFGAEAPRCLMARGLLVGALRTRLARGDDGPAVAAALLYGGSDLLSAEERDTRERGLRRWKPSRLAPDFVLCQQFAWSLAPGRAGYTRHQSELRELAVVATPASLRDRSALCLCLATVYAAHGALAELAAVRPGS